MIRQREPFKEERWKVVVSKQSQITSQCIIILFLLYIFFACFIPLPRKIHFLYAQTILRRHVCLRERYTSEDFFSKNPAFYERRSRTYRKKLKWSLTPRLSILLLKSDNNAHYPRLFWEPLKNSLWKKEESAQKERQSTKPTLLRGDALKIHVTNRRKIQNKKNMF